jgi:hypothetical protein
LHWLITNFLFSKVQPLNLAPKVLLQEEFFCFIIQLELSKPNQRFAVAFSNKMIYWLRVVLRLCLSVSLVHSKPHTFYHFFDTRANHLTKNSIPAFIISWNSRQRKQLRRPLTNSGRVWNCFKSETKLLAIFWLSSKG